MYIAVVPKYGTIYQKVNNLYSWFPRLKISANICKSHPIEFQVINLACQILCLDILKVLHYREGYFNSDISISSSGVATFVQGTVVQGDLCPRGQMSKRQFSKEILVRGDFCPRKLLPVISLLKLFFSILYWMLQY